MTRKHSSFMAEIAAAKKDASELRKVMGDSARTATLPFPASRQEAPVASAHADLMRFYSVDTPDALIAAQAHHIEKLQSKLQPAPSLAPQRVREG